MFADQCISVLINIQLQQADQAEYEFSDKNLFKSSMIKDSPCSKMIKLMPQNLRKSYYYAPPLNYNSRARIMSKLETLEQNLQKGLSSQKNMSNHKDQQSFRNQYNNQILQKVQKLGKSTPQKEQQANFKADNANSVLNFMNRKFSNPNTMKLVLVNQPVQKNQIISQTQRMTIKGSPLQSVFSPICLQKNKYEEQVKQETKEQLQTIEKQSTIDRQQTIEFSEQNSRGKTKGTKHPESRENKLANYLEEFRIVKPQNNSKYISILPKIQMRNTMVVTQKPKQIKQQAVLKQQEFDQLSLSGWSDNSLQF